jgi:outer membrane protein
MPMRRFALPLFALLVAASSAAARAEAPQDLLTVWRLARRSDPVLAAADATRMAQREGVQQARGALLPHASVSVSAARTHVADGSTSNNTERGTTLSLSQPLLDRAAAAQWRAAQAQADAQDAAYRAAEQDLALRVATAYFDVLNASDTLANVQANEDAFRQQVQQASDRQKVGLTAAVDVQQARAYHELARAQTLAAKSALEAARDALAEITGQPAGPLKGLRHDAPLLPPQPADLPQWIALALAHNPQLQAQQATVAGAQQQVAAARAGHWPTLSAGVDVGRRGAWPAPDANDGRNVTTVGLTLTVPLFAGGIQQSQVRQALYRQDAAADTLEAARRGIERTVQQRYRDELAAIAQTEIARAAVDAADKALASTRVGQGLGTQSMTDLLLAIQTLASARNAHALARYQAVLGRLQLEQAAGTLSEADLAATNELLQ